MADEPWMDVNPMLGIRLESLGIMGETTRFYFAWTTLRDSIGSRSIEKY